MSVVPRLVELFATRYECQAGFINNSPADMDKLLEEMSRSASRGWQIRE